MTNIITYISGKARLHSVALASVLVLAGCASPGTLAQPEAVVDPSAVGIGAAAPSAPLDDRWWQAFGDPELDHLVERALADSPSLKLAAARIRGAIAAVQGVASADQPQVNGTLDVTRQRYSENGLYPAPLAGSMQTSGTLQASLGWELDFFGRNRAAFEAALGTQRAAEAELQASRAVLAADVARTYFQLARLVAQREVAQRSLQQRDELLRLIRDRVQAGLDTNVELRQGEGALPEARQQIEALDEQIELLRHALAALTVQPPQSLAGLSPKLNPVQALALPTAVPADLLGRRADIAAARWRIEAATQGVAGARAAFYPDINLVAYAGFNALGLDKLLQAGSSQYGVGPAISLPIFDAGRLRASLHGKEADLDAAIDSYNATVIGAAREVADQIASLQSLQRQEEQQTQAQASAESAYDLAAQRYRAGLGSYLTVLNAETSVLAQRRQAADLKARALDLQAALMRALGGGYVAQDLPRAAAAAR